MSKREIRREFKSTPVVSLTQSGVGKNFIGDLGEGPRTVKTATGTEKFIFTFLARGGDMSVQKKDGDVYVEVDVADGDEVAVMASAPLADKIRQAKAGERLEIIFNGKKKGKKFFYNDFTVNILED